MKLYRVTLASLVLIAVPVVAQQTPDHGQAAGMKGMSMSKMQHGMIMGSRNDPFMSAEMTMHKKMMAVPASDVSEMWVRKMIEHHRGAIAMSRIAERDAKDAEARKIAAATIAEQQRGIAELQNWLKKHGKAPE